MTLVRAPAEDPTSETSVRGFLALTRTNSSVPAGRVKGETNKGSGSNLVDDLPVGQQW